MGLADYLLLKGGKLTLHVLQDGTTQELAVQLSAQGDLLTATNWYVNPSSGSDSNTGTSVGSPLKTAGEFFRRMADASPTVAVTLNLLGDCTGEGRIVFRGEFPLTLTVQGQLTTRHTGTITAHVAYNHTPGAIAYGTITDSALTGQWSNEGGVNLIDRRIILTSGTHAGAWARLLHDAGAKTAWVSTWFDPNTFGECFPADGDAYKVVDMTAIGPCLQSASVVTTVVQDCKIVGDDANFVPSFESFGEVTFYGCLFDGDGSAGAMPSFYASDPFFVGCHFLDGIQMNTGAYGTIFGCSFRGYNALVQANSTLIIDGPFSIGIRDGAGRSMEIDVAIAGYAIFQPGSGYGVITNGPGDVLHCSLAAAVQVRGVLWCKGALSGQGIWCANGAEVTWSPSNVDANTKFDFTGATNATVIGGTNKTIANLNTVGFINTANGTFILPGKANPSDT